MTHSTEDRLLLTLAAAGDQAALGELYDRHVVAVYAQASKVLGDRAMAEDVTQEVFITLWQKARSVRIVDASALPWLLVTARFLALNAHRRMVRERPSDAVDAEATAAGVDDAVVQREVEAAIAAAVAGLSAADSRLYELCIEGDQSYADAARTLGVSHASVRNRLSRVRGRLRSDLRSLRES